MSENSKIEWTDATWTPIRARRKDSSKVGVACVKVSPACKNCYAERLNMRNLPAHGTGLPYTVEALDQVHIFLDDEMLLAPLKWKRPRKIFVCSQTDLFGEFVPDEMIDRVFAVMALCPQHTFQVLTKRAARMERWFDNRPVKKQEGNIGRTLPGYLVRPLLAGLYGTRHSLLNWVEGQWPLPNVWLGVTAENQEWADERIPHLLRTPAAKRFVSVEPMLGAVDLTRIPFPLPNNYETVDVNVLARISALAPGIDWVIVGGESGFGARSMDIAWVRDLRYQCKAAGVACFVKQMGAKPYISYLNPNVTSWDDELINQIKLKDRKGGDMAEWPEDLRVREFPV